MVSSGSGDDNIFAIKTDSNANAFKLDQSGDIGIGTSPTDGNALSINGSLSTNNLLIIGTSHCGTHLTHTYYLLATHLYGLRLFHIFLNSIKFSTL